MFSRDGLIILGIVLVVILLLLLFGNAEAAVEATRFKSHLGV